MSVIRIVLDTNIFVSLLLRSPHFSQLANLIRSSKVKLAISPAQIAELTEVLHRPKFKFTPEDIKLLLGWLRNEAIFVTPDPLSRPVSRDLKDDFLLASARAGNADFILTGDEDLLVLKSFDGIPILSPAIFLSRIV